MRSVNPTVALRLTTLHVDFSAGARRVLRVVERDPDSDVLVGCVADACRLLDHVPELAQCARVVGARDLRRVPVDELVVVSTQLADLLRQQSRVGLGAPETLTGLVLAAESLSLASRMAFSLAGRARSGGRLCWVLLVRSRAGLPVGVVLTVLMDAGHLWPLAGFIVALALGWVRLARQAKGDGHGLFTGRVGRAGARRGRCVGRAAGQSDQHRVSGRSGHRTDHWRTAA